MEGPSVDKDTTGSRIPNSGHDWHYIPADNRKRKPDPPHSVYVPPRSSDRRSAEIAIQHSRAYGFAILCAVSGVLLTLCTLYLMRCYG